MPTIATAGHDQRQRLLLAAAFSFCAFVNYILLKFKLALAIPILRSRRIEQVLLQDARDCAANGYSFFERTQLP